MLYSLTSGTFTLVPDFTKANENAALNSLKVKCEAARPLGMVRCDASELLVVYDGA
jgi:hypothetical protein